MSLSDLSNFTTITLSLYFVMPYFQTASNSLYLLHSNFGAKFSKGGVYVMPYLILS